MNGEQYIKQKVGKQDAFNVPEGYFDELTSRVMSRLPESQQTLPKVKTVRMSWLKPLASVSAAAVVVGAVFIWHFASSSSIGDSEQLTSEEVTESEAEYIHNVMENSMLDDYSMYLYLAEKNDEIQ